MKLTAQFLLSLYLTAANAKDRFCFAKIQVTNNESAVLMLTPGMNTDGAFFFKEALGWILPNAIILE